MTGRFERITWPAVGYEMVRYAALGMSMPISDSGLPCVDVCEGKMLPLGRQLTVQHEHVQGSVLEHGMRTRNGSGPG